MVAVGGQVMPREARTTEVDNEGDGGGGGTLKAVQEEASPCSSVTGEADGADCGCNWGAIAVAGADYGGRTVTSHMGAAMEATDVEKAAMELRWQVSIRKSHGSFELSHKENKKEKAICKLGLLMVLRLMASPKDRGPRKNKRKWKEEEDDALIKVLKDLVNGGTSFKVDNGFLNTVAQKLKAKLPESNLKAQPHMHSRLRHFKGVCNVVYDMVVGSCTSGFGWDPETKSVVAEKEV
ncbi:hypothetical protein Cgig2_026264 [Carnegiea gigantea]|uniref:Myb/SANT-like domain-containing protein n=1 Tax=Carnegiea gigantea TaxID=171969 RepID=A0A9Q1JUH4_9CARY|nr:hypothetical protein Cgig2_026264 [Carnegiea gigantea]